MSIYFKFRSALEYTRLSIPSHSVASGDLKRLIVERKRLDREKDDFDLLLSYADSGNGGCGLVRPAAPACDGERWAAVIRSDLEHIPRNARILVRRLHADASRPGIMPRIHPQKGSGGGVVVRGAAPAD